MKKILVLLSIDEKTLRQTESTFEDEMGWVADSGISMEDYIVINKSNQEKQFAIEDWNLKTL